MKRSFILMFFFTANTFAQLTNTNVLLVTPAFITELAEEARTNNPALRGAHERVLAARANENSIRRWEDPMLRFGVMPAEKEMRADDGDLLLGVEQKLPLFGKPEATKRVAEFETKVEEAKSTFEFQQLRKTIAVAVFKTALAARTLEITEQDFDFLKTTLAVAEPRYEIGDASQMDILRLQNEHAKRANQIKTDAQNLEHEYLNLNRWLNRDLHSPWPKFRLPVLAKPVVYSEKLVHLALRNEPKLNVMREQIKQAEASANQAKTQRRPELGVGAEIRNFSETGEFRQGMLTLSLTVPWFNSKKYEADFKREKAKWHAAQYDAIDYALTVRDEVFHLTVQIDAARREALLYRDQIIPRTETSVKSARTAWETGSGDLEDLLGAQRMLLEAQLMYAKGVAEQYQMMSELVLCCGLGDLEALEMLGGQLGSETPKTK